VEESTREKTIWGERPGGGGVHICLLWRGKASARGGRRSCVFGKKQPSCTKEGGVDQGLSNRASAEAVTWLTGGVRAEVAPTGKKYCRGDPRGE